MGKSKVAQQIIENLGGNSNIQGVTHCATRLRFDIKNESLINETAIEQIKDVIGVVNKGGIYQLVIGPSVPQYYEEVVTALGEGTAQGTVQADENDEKQEETFFNKLMSYISGSIQPVLPVLIAAGMINALLAIGKLLGMNASGGTYLAWSGLASVGFTYLPVYVAFSAARKLRTNEYISAFITLAMIVCFNQQDDLSMFGIAIQNVKYANAIIPALLMVPLQAYLDKIVTRVVPDVAHFTLKPLILTLIVAPITLFGFGPIGAAAGGALANLCIWLMKSVGSLSMAFLAGLHPITVMFGMHYLFTPIIVNEVAELGFTFVLCRSLAANFAIAGSAMAVGVKAKKVENKSVGFSTSITALISVTEPALYGCLIRLRKPLISACAAAAITGLFIGLFDVRAYAIASPSLLSLPIFIGGESMNNFYLACVSALLAFILGFAITYVVGFNED